MKMLSRIIIGISFCLIMASSNAFAGSKEVLAEGKYVMGDLDTKQSARKLALLEAKRMALEQCGTYLESTSEVKNSSLTKDEISSLAAGIISVEIVDEKWQMSGEALMVIVKVKARVNTKDLEDRISSLKENKEASKEYVEIQEKLASLQLELEELKKSKAESPKKEQAAGRETNERYSRVVDEMGALDGMNHAMKAAMNQNWDQAVHLYSQIIAKTPDQTRAYLGRAFAYFKNHKPKKAMKDLEVILEKNPGIAKAHFLKGMILFKEEMHPEAIHSFVNAIKINPGNPKFFVMNGRSWIKLKNPENALKNFKRACRLGDQKGCQGARRVAERLNGKQGHDRREPPPHGPRRPKR